MWVANNAREVRSKTVRHFSPIELAMPTAKPQCSSPPEYIVQGRLGMRNVGMLLQMRHSDALSKRSFIIRHIGRADRERIPSSLLEWSSFTLAADSVGFTPEDKLREMLSRAAFMLPLITPDPLAIPNTSMYFNGKATSSVAVGVHYRLRFVGHSELLDE